MVKVLARGLRNNNPGNIRVSDANRWQGEVPAAEKKDATFEEFVTMAHGYRAMMRLLQNYQRRYGCKTVRDFIERWAPANENNTEAYVQSVCKFMGTTEDRYIDTSEKMVMCVLAAAISRVENGVMAKMEDIEKGWELL